VERCYFTSACSVSRIVASTTGRQKKTGMDKLYLYVRQMDQSMVRSKVLLDQMEKNYKGGNKKFSQNKMIQYFLQSTEISDYCNEFTKLDKINDNDDDSSTSSSSSSSSTEDDESSTEQNGESVLTLGDRLVQKWEKRKQKLSHDLSIAGWMLSPVPEIMKDASSAHDGDHRNAVERLLKRWIFENDVSPFWWLFFFF
jgi:hypothetical protein